MTLPTSRPRRRTTVPDALEGSPDAPTLYSRAGAMTVLDGSDRHPSDAELFALAGRSAPRGASQPGEAPGTRLGTQATIRRALTALAGGTDYVPDVPGSHVKQGTGSVLEPVAASRIIPEESERLANMVERGEIVPPPYDQRTLIAAYEESDTLPPVIEAMATGTSGNGLEISPTYPKTAEDGTALPPPSAADQQRDDLELFLAALAPRVGLSRLMHQVDTDTEISGNGYVEVVRDDNGLPAGIYHLPAYTMRLGPEGDPIEVRIAIRHPRTNAIVQLRRFERMRCYVQVRGDQVRYFKAYGDPRHLNRFTGQYRTPAAGPWGPDPKTGTARDASEVFHVCIYNPRSSYGTPRWIGALPHARSGRSAAELLVRWFDGAPIGAKLLLIAGGSVKEGVLEGALDQIDAMARGEENAFSIVSIEAQTDPAAATDQLSETSGQRSAISLHDLAFIPPEGVYRGEGNMIDGARKRIRSQFRLGPIHTGESDDYSHAAASAATAQAENSVFVPLRNQRWNPLLASLVVERGINLYEVKVKGANTTDHAEIAKGIAGIVSGGGASPNQLIRLMNQLTGQSQPLITEPWGDRPLLLTQSLLTLKIDPNAPLGEALETAKAEAAEQAEKIATGQAGGPPAGPGAADGSNDEVPEDVATRVLLAAHAAAEAGGDVGAAIMRVVNASATLRARRAVAVELDDLAGR